MGDMLAISNRQVMFARSRSRHGAGKQTKRLEAVRTRLRKASEAGLKKSKAARKAALVEYERRQRERDAAHAKVARQRAARLKKKRARRDRELAKEKFFRKTVKEGWPEEGCPICLNPFEEPRWTPCGHAFCRGCVVPYLKNNKPQCPVC